jgi:streptomycin 6-kinase
MPKLACTACSCSPCATRAGPRLLWSVKAARGGVRAVAAIPAGPHTSAARAGGALLATAGGDGAVRVWRGSDGRLLQGIEAAHYRCLSWGLQL